MNTAPWQPYANIMRDYFNGRRDTRLTIADDFETESVPIDYFFRGPEEFSPLDRKAVDLARGRVLDVGSGSGCHALALQDRGIDVVSLELMPELVEIQQRRGVREVRTGTIYDLSGDTFDTVLILMNGIGLAGTLEGLEVMFDRVRHLLRPGGQLLADSCDLRIWDAAGRPDDDHLYRPDGRYLGELHIQLEYEGLKAPPFPQLYADPDTLGRVAGKAGWTFEVVANTDPGYLARFTPR